MDTDSPSTGQSPKPWERQPGESARAFAAFIAYRDLGPRRSLREACRAYYQCETRAKLGQLEGWSAKWRWTNRAQSWDDEQDRAVREAQIEARKEMAQRHIKISLAFQERVIRALQSVKVHKLAPRDQIRWFVESVKIERLARGEPETILEQRGEINVKDDFFSESERAAVIAAILSRLGAVPPGPGNPSEGTPGGSALVGSEPFDAAGGDDAGPVATEGDGINGEPAIAPLFQAIGQNDNDCGPGVEDSDS